MDTKHIEKRVLSVAVQSNDGWRMIDDQIGTESDIFTAPEHRLLYQTIRQMRSNHEHVNALSLCNTLDHMGLLESAGGAICIAGLCAMASSDIQLETDLRIIREEYVALQMQKSALTWSNLGRIHGDEIANYLDVMLYRIRHFREIFEAGVSSSRDDIHYANEYFTEISSRLSGEWTDQLLSLGFGPYTDHRIQLDGDGGLIVLTGTPNSGKTAWFRCVLAQLVFFYGKRAALVSFEEHNKAKQLLRMIHLAAGSMDHRKIDYDYFLSTMQVLNDHIFHLTTTRREPTCDYILDLVDRLQEQQKIDLLVIDPYLYMEDTSRAESETDRIKNLLKSLRRWAEHNKAWVVVVAHPRKLNKDEEGKFEKIDAYTTSGSAHWANMADITLSVSRVFVDNREDLGTDRPSYTRVDVIKVRDQDLMQCGMLYFVRDTNGRYREYRDEFDCKSILTTKVPGDRAPWQYLHIPDSVTSLYPQPSIQS